MTDQTPDVVDVPSRDVSVADLTPARVEHGALVRPAASVPEVYDAFSEYQELVDHITNADDYQTIQGKRFPKRSALRKLGTAFGVSYAIVERTITRDDDFRVVGAEFVVRATAPGGRFSDGWGSCDVREKCDRHYPDCVTTIDPEKPNRKLCTRHCGGAEGGCDGRKHFSKPEHDIPATAETRAKNRAASELFAMGQVSAEEVDRQDVSVRQATRDDVASIQQAAKRLKDAGGNPGTWPGNIMGVAVLEDDGTGTLYPPITSAEARALVERLESAHVALTGAAKINDAPTIAEGSESGEASASTDAADASPSAAPSAPSAAAEDTVEGPAPSTAGPAGQADDAPAPSDEAPAPESGSQSPAPGGSPIRKGQQNQIGALATQLELDRDTRLAILGFVAQRPIPTMTDLTENEAAWAISGLKLVQRGALEWDGTIEWERGPGALLIKDQTDGMVDDPAVLPGAAWLRDFCEHHGLAFELEAEEADDQGALL